MTKARFQTLAWATLAVTLAVILWGAFVRATGSGAGCGSHWPTCNGEVIPRPKTLATVIEFTHRLSSGALGLMVLLELVWAFRAFPKGHPARRGAAAATFLMVTEALIGAALVLFEYVAEDRSVGRAAWMSIHLVNTFFLVAAITLTAAWGRGGARLRFSDQGLIGALAIAGALGTLIVGVSGAIAALGDTLFAAPSLARGIADDLSPAAHFLQQLRVIHPIAAVLVAVFLLYARAAIVSRRPSAEVRRTGALLAALIGLQLALGYLNLALLAPVWTQIVHLLVADLIWVTFVLFAAAALGERTAKPLSPFEAAAGAGLGAKT
jgi:cytochrome c oxidase assembly protein subunit 15